MQFPRDGGDGGGGGGGGQPGQRSMSRAKEGPLKETINISYIVIIYRQVYTLIIKKMH